MIVPGSGLVKAAVTTQVDRVAILQVIENTDKYTINLHYCPVN